MSEVKIVRDYATAGVGVGPFEPSIMRDQDAALAALRGENERLKEQRADWESEAERLRADRDHRKAEAERLAGMWAELKAWLLSEVGSLSRRTVVENMHRIEQASRQEGKK